MTNIKALNAKLDRQIARFRNLQGEVATLQDIVTEILALRRPKPKK